MFPCQSRRGEPGQAWTFPLSLAVANVSMGGGCKIRQAPGGPGIPSRRGGRFPVLPLPSLVSPSLSGHCREGQPPLPKPRGSSDPISGRENVLGGWAEFPPALIWSTAATGTPDVRSSGRSAYANAPPTGRQFPPPRNLVLRVKRPRFSHPLARSSRAEALPPATPPDEAPSEDGLPGCRRQRTGEGGSGVRQDAKEGWASPTRATRGPFLWAPR